MTEPPTPDGIELKFHPQPRYLSVLMTGPHIDENAAIDAWRRMAAECARLGTVRMLLENRLERQLSVVDAYFMASKLPELGLSHVRIAVVDRRGMDFSRARFAENVAVNRGINGRVFQEFEAAEAWLLSDNPS